MKKMYLAVEVEMCGFDGQCHFMVHEVNNQVKLGHQSNYDTIKKFDSITEATEFGTKFIRLLSTTVFYAAPSFNVVLMNEPEEDDDEF